MSMHPENTVSPLPSFPEVAARLKAEGFRKVSAHGGGATCCCPFHDDQNPSLSLFLNAAGKLGFKCHAGCDLTTERWKTLMKAAGAAPAGHRATLGCRLSHAWQQQHK